MKRVLVWIGIVVAAAQARPGVLDFLGFGKPATNQPATRLTSSLSQDQVVGGLKEALQKGVQQAINSLGHDGGFLTNLNVRIPMPPKLQSVERALRLVKEDKLADEFVATMNHAAEQAVPQGVIVFGDAIRAMSIQDAEGILLGPPDAATQYFRRTTETNLYVRFLPVVKRATDQTGVTSAYKRLMEKVTHANALGSFGQALLGSESVDLDAYVTEKALGGLFVMIAQEEKRIRENPVARTSELLQKVFGAVSRQGTGAGR